MPRWLPLLLLAGCDLLFTKTRDGQYGDLCLNNDMCARGLLCSREELCREPGEAGTAQIGESCLLTAACGINLACSANGECAEIGAPGTTGSGEACAGPEDCRAGLVCEGQICAGVEAPFWRGGDCPDPLVDAGAFRVLFEIPDGEALADFYRLPYPNDIRIDDSGNIDLEGHPSPGPVVDVLGDVVGNTVRAVEIDTKGFGLNQAVYFRFSEDVDLDSLRLGAPDGGTVALLDLTPGDTFGQPAPARLEARAERGAYICHNWLAVYPVEGQPLRPGHTYGVLITRDALDDFGNHATQDADFAIMLREATPPPGTLSFAWEKYAPLRSWITSRGLDPTQIAGATVFTTQDPGAAAEDLREATAELDTPEAAGLTLCGAGADPFADPADPTRGCQSDGTEPWLELQATVALPQYQAGTPPFKDAVDGGAIDLERRILTPERFDDVHISLVIPADAPMPQAGWPVILYAHGTGGNYTSAIRDGVADALVSYALPDGTQARFALLGFDAPVHGPRANPSAWKSAWLDVDPRAYNADQLFFNPLNPRAARDNLLQEAADMWSLVRLARAFDVAAGASPTGERLRLDKNHIYLLAHGQGAVAAPLFLAHEAMVPAAVIAGGGGSYANTLLTKTSPYDVPTAVAVALADPLLDRVHPILNLTQQVVERTEPLNHAGYVIEAPIGADPSRHVLQLFGVGDTFQPDPTQLALALALGLDQFTNSTSPLPGMRTVPLPASANLLSPAGGPITGLVGTYTAYSSDAHYVLFDRADAMWHVQTWFASALASDVPTVTGF